MIERTGLKMIALELLILPLAFEFKPIMIALIFVIAFTALFFRDPEREIGEGVVSPADGKIDHIEGRRVEIFMRPFDCHINRAPISGVVRRVVFKEGSRPPAFIRSERAMRNEIYIENEDGTFKVVQVAGIFARRIVCYVREGDYVVKGQRIGMIRFGSRVILEIPEGYKFVKDLGDVVKAGETLAVKS